MEEILLPYGERPLSWAPEAHNVTVLRCNDIPALGDLRSSLQDSLRRPIRSQPLRACAMAAGRIAILVSDATRLFPQRTVLAAVLDELSSVDPRRITIVVARGNHGGADAPAVGIAGDIASRFRIVNHDSLDGESMAVVGTLPARERVFFLRQALRHIGRSLLRAPLSARTFLGRLSARDWQGVRAAAGYTMFVRALCICAASFRSTVHIRREVVDAGLRILIGQIKPHFLAGFSGGFKAVFPGCAGRTGIAMNHFMMNHPSVALGRSEGNIIREHIEQAGRLCGESFAVNVVMNGGNRVAGIFAGDPVASHRRGAELCRLIGKVETPRADIVITAEGFPEAMNLYQLTKIVPAAAGIVRKGGAIICVGACRDGIGGLTVLNEIIFKIGFWNLLPRNVRVYLVSDLPRRDVEYTEFIYAGTVDEAVAREKTRFTTLPSVTVLSGAGLLIPEAVDNH
jgi:nickel-dependent lactate racemase